MSRIGKKPVAVPAGVEVKISAEHVLEVKGPKGTLTQQIDKDIEVEIAEGEVVLKRPTEQKRHKAMHGLYRALIQNMVVGVSEGYKKELELVGVGFKAANQGNILDLDLGYSHKIIFEVPSEVKVATETAKGKAPRVILESADKQLIGQVAAKLKSLRKVEPYKGKGVMFVGEYIRRKAGKAAGK
ncbi:50S ribosomal protein L6 [Sediminitomix flava]|uniref:Large ribosomal subunit protein uL6 n=1 Tax=Sediminitomix flava TaxID=379075 RepID=A0A315Z656_SEDFL|nr:50S ribosomal protein L6 [Sediminitomix flava]PWJ39357.1 LSU ribosomal protein L6P [Sediminitomix flava]